MATLPAEGRWSIKSISDDDIGRALAFLRRDPLINVYLISMVVFALGATLAALAGVVAGGFVGVYPGADFEILPYAFVVVIVGGMGSLKGALIGSLMVGLLDNFGKALFPELSYFTLFAPMAAILAVRPTGLFGRA
jgi:branched-chain amino acid transport system permease protein